MASFQDECAFDLEIAQEVQSELFEANFYGIKALLVKAADTWSTKSGIGFLDMYLTRSLPQDIMWRRNRGMSEDQIMEFYAGYAGWIAKSYEFKNLSKLIKKLHMSSCTIFNLEDFYNVFRSPGNADYYLWKTTKHANDIMATINPKIKVAPEFVAHALTVYKDKHRRAAILAVANMLQPEEACTIKQYRHAIEFLAASRNALFNNKIVSNIGEEFFIDPASKVNAAGYITYSAKYFNKQFKLEFCPIMEIDGVYTPIKQARSSLPLHRFDLVGAVCRYRL